jgi:hypothetical protein
LEEVKIKQFPCRLLSSLQVKMERPVQENVTGEHWGEIFEIAIQHSIPVSAQVVKFFI